MDVLESLKMSNLYTKIYTLEEQNIYKSLYVVKFKNTKLRITNIQFFWRKTEHIQSVFGEIDRIRRFFVYDSFLLIGKL